MLFPSSVCQSIQYCASSLFSIFAFHLSICSPHSLSTTCLSSSIESGSVLHMSLNRSYDAACLYTILLKRMRLFLWNVCLFLCPQSTGRKQSTFADLNLNDSPLSSYRPRLVSWVENFIVAPMLSISCDRNEQHLVPAWSRIHLGKATAMLLKEFLFLVKPKGALSCSHEPATAH
jgi:hypothetical protein